MEEDDVAEFVMQVVDGVEDRPKSRWFGYEHSNDGKHLLHHTLMQKTIWKSFLFPSSISTPGEDVLDHPPQKKNKYQPSHGMYMVYLPKFTIKNQLNVGTWRNIPISK